MKTLDFGQMEKVDGGMSCGMALGLYGASFILLCAATGGLAVLSAFTFGGSVVGVFESC